MQRPDLSRVSSEVKDYIEYLEAQIQKQQTQKRAASAPQQVEPEISTAPLPAEPPTTIQIITVSRQGRAKRTLRHLYTPQHRGGVGVFDIEVPEPDFPSILANIDQNQNLLLFTSRARVFRYPLNKITQDSVRGRGEQIDRLPLEEDEYLAGILPEQAQGYVAMVSQSGRVKALRHHVFGEHMKPGTAMYSFHEFGPLASVTWTNGDGDLFIATESGIAIRFSEKLISPQGDWGIKVAAGDRVVAISSIYPDSGVFLLTRDGKGTIRRMDGFAPNKSAGGSGKLAMKTDRLLSAFSVEPHDSIFAISKSCKIIRFRADEVPETDGVVQGVNCMMLRNDEVTAVTKSGLAL